jgi:hypothetical protein
MVNKTLPDPMGSRLESCGETRDIPVFSEQRIKELKRWKGGTDVLNKLKEMAGVHLPAQDLGRAVHLMRNSLAAKEDYGT